MVRKRRSDAGKPESGKQGNRSLKNALKRLINGIMMRMRKTAFILIKSAPAIAGTSFCMMTMVTDSYAG